MNSTLERLRDDVRFQLGQFYAAPSVVTDQTLDAALRDGLQKLQHRAETKTETFVVETAGYNFNLAALIPDLLTVMSVTFPWDETYPPTQPAFPYQMIGRATVHFQGVEPQPGEKMRVTYRPKFLLAELDSATTTTLPAEYEPILVKMSCASLMRTISMQLAVGANGEKADAMKAQMLAQQSITLVDEAYNDFSALLHPIMNPVWSRIGL